MHTAAGAPVALGSLGVFVVRMGSVGLAACTGMGKEGIASIAEGGRGQRMRFRVPQGGCFLETLFLLAALPLELC